MTNELKKAIETVKEYLDIDSDVDSEYLNAQRTIIDALEAQPTDAVSRQDVDAYIAKLMSGYLYDEERTRLEEFSAYLWELPFVTPRTNLAKTSQDCISREAVLEGLANMAKAKAKSDAQKSMMGRCMFFVEQLPSVTPQRPKGKWIEIFVETPNDPYNYGFKAHKCSKCEYRPLQISNYCPNCGADNSESTKELFKEWDTKIAEMSRGGE